MTIRTLLLGSVGAPLEGDIPGCSEGRSMEGDTLKIMLRIIKNRWKVNKIIRLNKVTRGNKIIRLRRDTQILGVLPRLKIFLREVRLIFRTIIGSRIDNPIKIRGILGSLISLKILGLPILMMPHFSVLTVAIAILEIIAGLVARSVMGVVGSGTSNAAADRILVVDDILMTGYPLVRVTAVRILNIMMIV